MDKKEDFETIKVNEKEDTREYTFPSLELSKFERQMRAFNSYSALDKFKNRTNVSPTFEFDTKGNLTSGNLLDLKNQGTSKFSIDYAGKISSNGLDAGSNKITSVTDPTSNQDAATKNYVDTNGGIVVDSDLDSRTSGDGTGDKTITHSLGTTPSLIIIKANLDGGIGDVQDAWSYGYIKATDDRKLTSHSQYEGGNTRTSDCIYLRQASGDYWEGDISSISSSNFVLHFNKYGSPNTCFFVWWAIA